MWFGPVELKNFCQHKHLEFELSRRLTGVIGPNGSGKSNVLASLEYLLTGSVPLAGNKDSNVYQGIGSKESSYVAGTLQHGPHTLQIVRGLKKVKSSLAVDGGDPILGDERVSQELARLLGGAWSLFSDYVFVKQSKMYEFLDAPPGERAAAYQQLFGTKKAEQIYEALGKVLGSVSTFQTTALLDDVRKQVGDTSEELAKLKRDYATFADVRDYKATDDPNTQIVKQWESYQKARDRCAAWTERLDTENERLLSAVAQETEAAADVATLQTSCDEGRESADEARVLLATWQAVVSQRKTKARLEKQAAELAAEKAARVIPVKPAGDAEEATLQQEWRVWNSELDRLEIFVRSFKEGVAECPKCGTPVATFQAKIDDANERIAVLSQRLEATTVQLDTLRRYNRELREYNTWLDGFKKRERQLNVDREAFEEQDPPEISAEDLNEFINAQAELEVELKQARSRAAAAEQTRAAAQARVNEISTQLALARAERKSLKMEEQAFLDAQASLEATTARVVNCAKLSGQIAASKTNLAQLRAQLDRLVKEAELSEKTRKFTAHANAIREVVHRNRLPRVVASSYLTLIQEGVNTLLGEFDAGFTVVTEQDLSFTALFTDGTRMPAVRLSGGQKVLLALAFRCEINAVFAADIGLLCLDEPTAALDANNVRCIEIALAKIGQVADTRGLQCVLVTHERELGPLFNKVISMG